MTMGKELTRYSFLEKVGLVSISLIGYQLFRTLMQAFYDHVLAARMFHHNIILKDMGEWAVVTGATAGIGKAYAMELAKQKLNVVLIGRNKEKLEETSTLIVRNHGVQTHIIVTDFTNVSKEEYKNVETQMFGLEIGILINNVGLSYPHPEYFLDLPNAVTIYSDIIKSNIYSVTNMCMMVLPQMVQRGRGVVINIASSTADIPSPLLTVYSASKAYIEKFSMDLECEYNFQGIVVQCLTPGYVATNMSKIANVTYMTPNPTQYVESAMPMIGIQTVTTGYVPHTCMVFVVNALMNVSPSFMKWFIRRSMEKVRGRAMRKYLG